MTFGPASDVLGISAERVVRPAPPTAENVGRAQWKKKRYDILRNAQSVLYDPSAGATAQHRTCYCQRGIHSAAGAVTVRRARDGAGASLGGVATCASAWTCAVCGLRIAAQRQAEVEAAMKAHIAGGGFVFLMTRTFPHEHDAMPLAETVAKLSDARRIDAQGKTYRRVLSKAVRTGSITALEVTHGAHGWHPHTHTLLFLTPDALGETRELEDGRLTSRAIDELKAAWFAALVKVGLADASQRSDVLAHGLDIRGGQYAADYVSKFARDAKWGLSREVAMQAGKTGGGAKGVHPMQLAEWGANGDAQAAVLFREYAAAFKGRAMLNFSPGLKKALGLDELEESDEELAARAEAEEVVIAHIDAEAVSVLAARRMLGEFLAFVAEYCYDPTTAQADVDDFMAYARGLPRRASGAITRPYYSSRQRYAYDAEREGNEQRT